MNTPSPATPQQSGSLASGSAPSFPEIAAGDLERALAKASGLARARNHAYVVSQWVETLGDSGLGSHLDVQRLDYHQEGDKGKTANERRLILSVSPDGKVEWEEGFGPGVVFDFDMVPVEDPELCRGLPKMRFVPLTERAKAILPQLWAEPRWMGRDFHNNLVWLHEQGYAVRFPEVEPEAEIAKAVQQ